MKARRPASIVLLLTTLSLSIATASAAPAGASATASFTSIATGTLQTCALTTSGGVQCWGAISGLPVTLATHVPVDVVGLTSGVAAIAKGGNHACALTTSGGVKCWGGNENGELGDGSETNTATPVDVVGLSSGVASISAGFWHTCAVTMSGAAKCWGANMYGQLGNGTKIDSPVPVDVVGLTDGVATIEAGADHTCILTVGRAVKCWGTNTSGQLGNGTTTDSYVPVPVVGMTNGIRSIAAGFEHTCAVTISGGARCWGGNHYGQLGDGTGLFRRYYVNVTGLNSAGVLAIAPGLTYTCALLIGGVAKCWGTNQYGRLGNGTTANTKIPLAVSGLVDAVGLATDFNHTCAVMVDGRARCWGSNEYGQLGNDSTMNSSTPVDVGAPPLAQPDGLLSVQGRPFVGDHIYNATGVGQISGQELVAPGASVTFQWQIQNDGTLAHQIRLSGQGKSPGFTVKFTLGAADITAAVVAGTFTRSIAPGGSITVTLKMTALASAPFAAIRGNIMTATSHDGSALDTVVARVQVGS